MKVEFEHIFESQQQDIIDKLSRYETADSCKISDNTWSKSSGGGGRTFVIEEGAFFDKAAVNFSSIIGTKLPDSATGLAEKKEASSFKAMGVSVITHPTNPYIPTSHMNIRMFLILNKKKELVDWWVGGGYDLTPYFIYEEDCIRWHKDAKTCLDAFDSRYYEDFAKNCDEYFFLPHRNEKRGIGGIFFDNLNDLSIDESLKMLQNVSNTYIKSFLSIINTRKDTKFTQKDKDFQEYRRGRYVEFNLILDRGTKFGLQSGGRIESILASLPSKASWVYKKDAFIDKNEAKLLKGLKKKYRG